MTRILALLLALVSFTLPAQAADDISAVSRGVVRVVTVAMVDGEVVGFGHGSGIAVSPTHIVTNAHVVESAVKYPNNVALGVVPSEGKKSYSARLIAIDSVRDLALIEITQGRVPPAAIYSGPFEAGEHVVALGYPGNVDLASARSSTDYITPRTPVRSEGNLSNQQAVNGIATLVHTAKIARGNSGGPLVDLCGRIVGINTFITRADDGDSPFAFAVSNRELMRFLSDSDQKYNAIGTACLTMDEANARDRAALDAETKAEASANQARDEAERLDQELKRERAEEAALAARENRIALSGVLFVLGAFGAAFAFFFHNQKKMRNAKIAGAIGVAMILIAAALFFTRPGTIVNVSEQPTPTAKESGARLAEGKYICSIQPQRSRITVSPTTDVPVAISASGCVNDRTQYASGADGRWQRILVPNEEATVTVASIDVGAKEYRVERYLLDADAMAKAREIRAGVEVKSCTASADQVAALATQQDAIRAVLPASPNERLVYGCQAIAPAVK